MNIKYVWIGQSGFVRKLGRAVKYGDCIDGVPKDIAGGMVEEGVLELAKAAKKKEVTENVV